MNPTDTRYLFLESNGNEIYISWIESNGHDIFISWIQRTRDIYFLRPTDTIYLFLESNGHEIFSSWIQRTRDNYFLNPTDSRASFRVSSTLWMVLMLALFPITPILQTWAEYYYLYHVHCTLCTQHCTIHCTLYIVQGLPQGLNWILFVQQHPDCIYDFSCLR